MDLGAFEVRTGTVQYSRPQLRSSTSQHSMTPVNAHHDDPSLSSIASTPSDPTTAIRWATPQSRLLTPPVTPKTAEPESTKLLASNEIVSADLMPQTVRFDEEQVRSVEAQASERPKVDDSGPPTPSNDDTPYIRFAIDQLTREEEIRTLERQTSGSSADSYPVARIISDHRPGYQRLQNSQELRKDLAAARKDRDALQGEQEEGGLFRFNATRPLTSHSNPTLTDLNLALKPSLDSEIFIPVPPPQKTSRYPNLTYVPAILRPFSTCTLSLLCVLMIAAIIFCAVDSQQDGLARYTAGIYGGRYFVFGFLPQFLAACILIYVQAVMAAIARIMPYTLMAMDEANNRAGALFLGIYPRCLLWPRWDGHLTINLCNLGFWFSVFTIPLQGCLFTVIPTSDGWRWAAVQGVAWTLVTIYVLILISTIMTCIFFFRRRTGLMWDPRSLADIISILPRSNSLREYPGTETMETKQEIKNRLASRSDRLGYWRTPKRTQAMFYCLGEEGASTRQYTLSAGKLHEKSFGGDIYRSVDLENVADLYSPNTRFRHLPWFLRDTFVILWSVAAFVILLAIIIVSFLPTSAIRKGFSPQIPVIPNDAGFSAANFLYSFIPSVLGMILYLLFQPLDMAFRKLQPWASLSNPEGMDAEHSLLLDYPAALPVACTISALSLGHYRVAILSLLSFVFVLLPILSGGLFFALTIPSGAVRMIPNLSAFYVLLVLLGFYLLGLLVLIPGRYHRHLPHGVDSLSEIISFVHGSRLLDDAAFRAPRSRADLATRLMAVQREGGVAKFAFGVYRGRHGKECLGIDRLGRMGGQEVMVLSGR
ncbi:phosphoribosylaminoimidazole-succinocarboxamide synthase [Phlyctema vagabunda]|uniref:Phosphoribosylaminoimidazole-succinocarboxamide synthase n=1 Tax=Phlyctema vagabunda TaxID=108571 RepID=A0ABR4PAY5_9HELO